MNFKLYYLDKESLEIKFIDLFANPPSRFPEKTIKLLVADNKLFLLLNTKQDMRDSIEYSLYQVYNEEERVKTTINKENSMVKFLSEP